MIFTCIFLLPDLLPWEGIVLSLYIKRDFQKSPSQELDSVNLVMCVRCSNFLTLKVFACGLSFLWMPLAYISITFRETQITSISKSK